MNDRSADSCTGTVGLLGPARVIVSEEVAP